MQPGFLIPHNQSRRVIASYKMYLEAQKAVDFLSDKGFTVEKVAIVAEELRFVEQITGRLDSGKAALSGGLRGGAIGVMIGLALVAEGLEFKIPKGYIYFAMAFSVLVELLNIRIRRRGSAVHLQKPAQPD